MVIAILTAKRSEVDGLATLAGFLETSYLVMFLVLAIGGAGGISLDGLLARRLPQREPLALSSATGRWSR
jgi:uncharacterized membrane protein YphA (DoxX/SURF4 family)